MKRRSKTVLQTSTPSELDKLLEENLRIAFNTLSSTNDDRGDGSSGGGDGTGGDGEAKPERTITTQDLRNAFSAFGHSLTDEQLNKLFQEHSYSQDHRLNFDQFQSLVRAGSGGGGSVKSASESGEAVETPLETLKSIVNRLALNEDLVSRMLRVRAKKAFLCDMDGVVYRGGKLLPGVSRFLSWVKHTDKKLLFITNNSKVTPEQLQARLAKMDLQMPKESFFTAAQSCAAFLRFQKPHGCTAYCVGGVGIQLALHDQGVTLTDDHPDYVVIGENDNYTCEQIKKATKLVHKGSKLIGTNIDACGPIEDGIQPSCGAWTSVIEKATNKAAYFTGKPNPFMMRAALCRLECHSSEVAIVGDRMDTDCIAGIESMIDSILVLTGVSTRETMEEFPYRPYLVLEGVGDIVPDDFEE